jgi:hypothetical protein
MQNMKDMSTAELQALLPTIESMAKTTKGCTPNLGAKAIVKEIKKEMKRRAK